MESTSKCENALEGAKPICYIPFKMGIKSPDQIVDSNQPLFHLEMALRADRNRSVIICSTEHQSKLCVQSLEKKCMDRITVHLPSLIP